MGRDPVNDDTYRYNENLAEANNAEFGPLATPGILPGMAEGIAASATGPDDAYDLCRDLANAEDLDEAAFGALVAQVEAQTGWELPRQGEGH